MYYRWEKNKKVIQKNPKISAPAWNEEFELPNGSYSASDTEDYFKCILKKQTVADNTSMRI